MIAPTSEQNWGAFGVDLSNSRNNARRESNLGRHREEPQAALDVQGSRHDEHAGGGRRNLAGWRTDRPQKMQPIAGSPSIANGKLLVPWGDSWTLREGTADSGGLTVYGS